MAKRTELRFATLGEKISIYITKRGAIARSKSSDVISATVIGFDASRPYHGILGPIVHNVLLGWKAGDEMLTSTLYDNAYTVERAAQYKMVNRVGDHYEPNALRDGMWYFFVEDIKDYYRCIWLAGNTLIPAGTTFTNHPDKRGPFTFISAVDIQPGDTVAWNDDGKLAYISVQEIDEYEGARDTPMVALRGDVFNAKGMRKFTSGYPMGQAAQVLLINRGE